MSGKRKDVIGEKEVAKAQTLLMEYQRGKQSLDERIVDEEKWWRLRHWEALKNTAGDTERVKPTSAWLFNSIANKHADAMDNYPEPNVLPRERQDEALAKTLSAVLPVVVERNNFESVYSDAWWYKLKHGAVCYGVFWDSTLENGLGDIKITEIDLLNVYWKPGIKSIQDSPNLFITSFAEEEQLKEQYPQLQDKSVGRVIDIKEYVHDDNIDRSSQVVVVDWYYKKTMADGRTLLHYCKFAGNTVLYASENDQSCRDAGWYEHGQYPFEIDVLYPEADTPAGFGQISIARDPQMYIDKLNQLLLENAALKCRPRYFASEGSGICEEELLDMSKTIIHIQGNLNEERLRKFEVDDLPANVFSLMTAKIDELKETSSNRDVSQGSSSSGITSGAAITALQEAGNKTSRDMILSSYRTYTKLMYFVIELIRQFYTSARTFRITGENGQTDYAEINSRQLTEETDGKIRKPIFDIVIKPQKRSAYSKLSQNELAKEMYNMGFFNPQNAEPALTAIDMMDFDGKQKVRDTIEKGQTLQKQIQEMQEQMMKMTEIIEKVTKTTLTDTTAGAVMPAKRQKGKTDTVKKTYGERLADNARANALGVE